MPLHTLDHANIRTANLDTMIAFYEDVLGMTNGMRADFPFPGAWLYLGDTAVVHLVAQDKDATMITGEDVALEHVAFRATGLKEFRTLLEARGIDYYLGHPPGVPIVQVNILDPDGNHLHIDFHTDELEND